MKGGVRIAGTTSSSRSPRTAVIANRFDIEEVVAWGRDFRVIRRAHVVEIIPQGVA